MTQDQVKHPGWPLVAGLVALAAALGFSASHLFAPRHVVVATPAAAPAAAAASTGASDSAAAEIKIPTEYLSGAGIGVEAVGDGGLQAEILTSGVVVAPPGSDAVVVARASGAITRVNRQLGDTVRAGETLALVASQEASTMAADRSAALARAELARKNLARESSLFTQGVTARQDMEAAQAALAVAEAEARRASAVVEAAHVAADGVSVAVVSPISGRITARMATLGAAVQEDTELFRVAGDGPVQVEAALPAADLGRVAVGDKATIVAAGGAPLDASVRALTPTASGNTRSATVVLTPSGPARGLVVGAGVQARLHVKGGAKGLVVPEDAVQHVDGHDVLFVRTKDGFRVQPVLVGTRSGGVAQVISGVSAGQSIATRNAFLIKAEMIKSAQDE